MIWLPGQNDTRHRWISRCRQRLERDDDYPVYAEQWAKIRALQAKLTPQQTLILESLGEPT